MPASGLAKPARPHVIGGRRVRQTSGTGRHTTVKQFTATMCAAGQHAYAPGTTRMGWVAILQDADARARGALAGGARRSSAACHRYWANGGSL